jgi:regulatory protein
MDYEKALSKAATLCSAAEKCCGDIRQKLVQWEVDAADIERIVAKLKQEKYIDDSRFAGYFARDKFRFNHWGKRKIAFELSRKSIEPSIIRDALDTIEENEYIEAVQQLLAQKYKVTKGKDAVQKQAALVRFGTSRGFEPDLVFKYTKVVMQKK